MNSKAYSSSFRQFIALNSFGKLVLNPKATSIIRSLPAPISIVSMIGPKSSGKSFLLSHLANEFNSTSQSSEQLESNTNICVSAKPLLGYNEDGKITSILLFDTPGIDLQNERADNKLLILMLLISTSVFYNTKIQRPAQFVREMKKLTNLLDLFPNFTKHFSKSQFNWIFRDFDRKIQNQFGVSISEKQYFQNYLLSLNTDNENVVNAIKTFLPQRNCHFFIKPSFDQDGQHPLFWEQVIKLRKSLTDLPSMNIQGSDFVLLLSTYIQALNNDDSLQKVIQQGADCLTRIRCLDRLNDELKSLEQQSMNSIDGIQQKLFDIKANLNEYFKQRMMSAKQIQALDQELAQIIHQFRELNQIKSSPQSKSGELSPSKLRVKVNRPEKFARYSINIDESDVQKNDYEQKSLLSFTRINTSKVIQSRLQECEAKLYRYQLQSEMIRNETSYFKQEYEKLKKEVELKNEQYEELAAAKNAKEKEYQAKLEELQQKIKTVHEEKILALSQNEKLTLLTNDKISYLQTEISQLSECFNHESEERQQKYKAKINEYVNEIAELTKAHQQEIIQLKLIYKSNIDKMAESNYHSRTDKVIRAGVQSDSTVEQLNQDIAKYRTKIGELEALLVSLNQKFKANDEKTKVQAEKAQKRLKEMEIHLQTMHNNQILEKEAIIKELQLKNGELLRKLEESQMTYHLLSEESNNLIRQLRLEVLQKSQRNEETNGQLSKFQSKISQYQRELEEKNFELNQRKTKIESCLSTIESLQKQKLALTTECKGLRQENQKLRYQSHLSSEKLNQVIENQKNQHQAMVNTKARELQELKKLQEVEKKGYLSRLEQLNQELQIYRPYKYHFQDLQVTSSEKQNQFTELLMQNENSLGSLRHQLEQSEQQLAKNQEHINFLTTSLADLNQQYSNHCTEYSSHLQELELHCSKKINDYITEISELKSELKQAKTSQQKLQTVWQKKQKQYQHQLGQITSKIKDVEQRQQQKRKQMQLSHQNSLESQSHQLRQKNKEIQQLQQVCNKRAYDYEVGKMQFGTGLPPSEEQVYRQPNVTISIANVFQTNEPSHFVTLQHKLEKDQLQYQIKLLREKIENMAQKYNQELSAKNSQVKKLQESIQTIKNETTQQNLKQRQKAAALKHQLNIRQAQRIALLQNIDTLQAKYRSDRQKNQNYLNLLQRRIKQSKEQNQKLVNTLQQYRSDYQHLQEIKKRLESNYNRDCALWTNKYDLLQQRHSL